jgi:hypothetical protein
VGDDPAVCGSRNREEEEKGGISVITICCD